MPDLPDNRSAPPHASIGPYRILSQIARRTHSAVYKVRNAAGEVAALKALSAGMATDPAAQARFQQELANLRRIDHPNVAHVLDNGIAEDGRPYIVLEFVEGSSLEQLLLDRLRLSPIQAMDLAIQACEGLRAALKERVIHLDIKPGNLLVDSRSLVLKVVDFGLSKLVWEPEAAPKHGVTYLGTPRYMSPEHCRGNSLDHRSDLYSLGATFYHLLAGRPPFDAPTYEEVMRLIMAGRPAPLEEVNPEIPQDLCDVIMRLLQRDPNERFQDYPSVLAALDAARLSETARQQHRLAQAEVEARVQAHTAGAPPHDGGAQNRFSGTVPLGGPPPPSGGVVVDEHEIVEAERQRRGAFHPIALIAVLTALALAIVTVVVKQMTSPPGSRSAIGALARSLFAPAKNDAATQRNLDNRDRMRAVAGAVGRYRAAYGRDPESLSELEGKVLVPVIDATDVWGHRFLVLPDRGIILCLGLDGKQETEDDWIMTFDGKLDSGPASVVERLDPEEEFQKKGKF